MATKQKPRSKEEWRKIICQCAKRQGSIPKWCAENGINVTTYMYWVNRLNKEAKSEKESPLSVFAELSLPMDKVPDSQTSWNCQGEEIVIHCGVFEIMVN